jgi:DNA ligase-3
MLFYTVLNSRLIITIIIIIIIRYIISVISVFYLKQNSDVKILSQIFVSNFDDMIEDLEKGDVAETAKVFYEVNGAPAKTSTLTIQDVDKFLDKMADLTREDDQKLELSKIVKKCPYDYTMD